MAAPRLQSLSDGGTSPLRELASGVDALYFSGRATLDRALLDRLNEEREFAEQLEASVPVSFGGEMFRLAPRALGKHRFWLEHPHGQLGITQREKLPTFRVQPRAEFLHGVGPAGAVEWFANILELECGTTVLTVSRIDLHTDWQGLEFSGQELDRFVCRGDERTTRVLGDANRFTGHEFGKRSTNTVCGRIYDKTEQIQKSGAGYWPLIWGDEFDESLPVIRVELEYRREVLHEFKLQSPGQALDALADLWRYGTEDWLSLRVRGNDSNKSRWEVAPEWRRVQQVQFGCEAHGLARMYRGRVNGEMAKLAPILFGALSSMAALTDKLDISEVIPLLPEFSSWYERKSEVAFADRALGKRRKLGLAS